MPTLSTHPPRIYMHALYLPSLHATHTRTHVLTVRKKEAGAGRHVNRHRADQPGPRQMTASDIGVTNILSCVGEKNPWPVLREQPPATDARWSWLAVRRGVQPSAVTAPLEGNPCCSSCMFDWLQNPGDKTHGRETDPAGTMLGLHVLIFVFFL